MGFPEQPVSLFSGPARGLELSSVSREAGRPEAGHDLVIQQEYVADLKEQAARAIDTFNVADVR